MGPAQWGMIAALILAVQCGIVVGAKQGLLAAIVGAALGVVTVLALVPLAIAAVTFLSRLSGRNPREIEDRIAVMSTWAVAVTAAIAVTGALLGFY